MGVRDPVGEQAVTVRQGLEQDNSQSSGFRVPRGRRDRQGEVSQREERGRQRQRGRGRCTQGQRERGREAESETKRHKHAHMHKRRGSAGRSRRQSQRQQPTVTARQLTGIPKERRDGDTGH